MIIRPTPRLGSATGFGHGEGTPFIFSAESGRASGEGVRKKELTPCVFLGKPARGYKSRYLGSRNRDMLVVPVKWTYVLKMDYVAN